MIKPILILTLLLSANAFAEPNKSRFIWSDKCLDGRCTSSEIEGVNRENYQNHLIHIQNLEAEEAEDEREWVLDHQRRQAKADALSRNRVNVIEPMKINCVGSTYDKASTILGDDARKHIEVTPLTLNECAFSVKDYSDEGRGCNNLASLAGIAEQGFYQEEQCRFAKESWKVYEQYKDVIYTPEWTSDLSREYQEKLKPINKRHEENVSKLIKQEQQLSKIQK